MPWLMDAVPKTVRVSTEVTYTYDNMNITRHLEPRVNHHPESH